VIVLRLGGIQGINSECFAEMVWKAEIIFSSCAVLVLGYGELACSGVMLLTLSLIGSK
jgi:hypothetical protein